MKSYLTSVFVLASASADVAKCGICQNILERMFFGV